MFNKLTDRVYYMDFVEQGDRPVLGLVVGDKYSLVIDGGNSKEHAEKFLKYVSELNVPEVKYLVLTHWHWDHVFGMKYMNLINIVNKKTNEKLNWMRNLKWDDESIRKRVESKEEIEFCEENIKIEHPSNERLVEIDEADIIFDKEITIDLGGVTVKVENIDVDHSEDSCLVNVVEEKVTFMGDAMYLDMFNGPWSLTKEKLYPFLDRLTSYDSNYYVPAHHPKYTKTAFEDYIKNIKELCEIVDDSTDLEKSIAEVTKARNSDVPLWDVEDIRGFVNANRKKLNK